MKLNQIRERERVPVKVKVRVRERVAQTKPDPIEPITKEEVAHRLNNILEWTDGRRGREIRICRAISRLYAKGISNRRDEYYFGIVEEETPKGKFYLIVSVLKKTGPRPVWDTHGNPVKNCVLVDNMRDCRGLPWRQGFYHEAIKHLLTEPLIKPLRVRTRDTR